jgi:hypothetical protein
MKPWSSWSRIDRNHPRIRPRGSKWCRNQQEAAAAAAAGERIRSTCGGYHRRLRCPARAARSTPGGGSSKPRSEKSNRIESHGGGRAELGTEQLPRTEFQHQSRPRQQQPEANRGRSWLGDQGMGFEAWERGIFPNRGIPCPPTLRKSSRARVRLHAISRARTNGGSKSYAAGGAERGKTKTRGGKRGEQPRQHAGNSSAHAKGWRGGKERDARRVMGQAPPRVCRGSIHQRAPPLSTHQARGAGAAARGPGRRRATCRRRGWLVAEPDVAGSGSGGARVSVDMPVSPWRRVGCPGQRRPEALGDGGEGRGGSDGSDVAATIASGGGCVAGGARGHKWDGDGWSLRAPGGARRWPAGRPPSIRLSGRNAGGPRAALDPAGSELMSQRRWGCCASRTPMCGLDACGMGRR